MMADNANTFSMPRCVALASLPAPLKVLYAYLSQSVTHSSDGMSRMPRHDDILNDLSISHPSYLRYRKQLVSHKLLTLTPSLDTADSRAYFSLSSFDNDNIHLLRSIVNDSALSIDAKALYLYASCFVKSDGICELTKSKVHKELMSPYKTINALDSLESYGIISILPPQRNKLCFCFEELTDKPYAAVSTIQRPSAAPASESNGAADGATRSSVTIDLTTLLKSADCQVVCGSYNVLVSLDDNGHPLVSLSSANNGASIPVSSNYVPHQLKNLPPNSKIFTLESDMIYERGSDNHKSNQSNYENTGFLDNKGIVNNCIGLTTEGGTNFDTTPRTNFDTSTGGTNFDASELSGAKANKINQDRQYAHKQVGLANMDSETQALFHGTPDMALRRQLEEELVYVYGLDPSNSIKIKGADMMCGEVVKVYRSLDEDDITEIIKRMISKSVVDVDTQEPVYHNIPSYLRTCLYNAGLSRWTRSVKCDAQEYNKKLSDAEAAVYKQLTEGEHAMNLYPMDKWETTAFLAIVDCMVEVRLMDDRDTVKIGGRPIPAYVVAEEYKHIEGRHVTFLLSSLNSEYRTTEVNNWKAYIRASLYNVQSHYTLYAEGK